MPRIQILPLPEGAADERPPFALVIDQADETITQSLAYGVAYDSDNGQRPLREALKADLGARAILVFEDTIEIPANDVSAYIPSAVNLRIEDLADADSAELAEHLNRRIELAQARSRTGTPR
ncbi:hypothetical protein [Streptomyces sp. enrichment culture]|uniref:hypothetical protein n=1 Tax=Streptomyces sp. enrichment culture TaxID=1795815 RepID=UPI003F558949